LVNIAAIIVCRYVAYRRNSAAASTAYIHNLSKKGRATVATAGLKSYPPSADRARMYSGPAVGRWSIPGAGISLGARRSERERRAPGRRAGTRRACLGVPAHDALVPDGARPQEQARPGRLPRRDHTG
jgi:hypothetical protein